MDQGKLVEEEGRCVDGQIESNSYIVHIPAPLHSLHQALLFFPFPLSHIFTSLSSFFLLCLTLPKQEGNLLLTRVNCVYWVMEETPELRPRQAQVMGVDVGQVR